MTAQSSEWFPLPPAPLLVGQAEPYLVLQSRLDEFRRYVAAVGASPVDVLIGEANGAAEVIDALKAVLPFPGWCGSGWDSIDDAFEEIRRGWGFPLVVVVHGLESLITRRPHLGFNVVIRMSELSHAFSVAGDQLMVTSVGTGWG